MLNYSSSHKIWYRDTLDMITSHASLSPKEIETIVVESIIKYLDKSIALPMLADILKEIQNVKPQVMSSDLSLVLNELTELSNSPTDLQQAHKDRMYNMLENVLDLMTTGR